MNQQKLNTNNTYSTSDLALATAISLFVPLDSVDTRDPRRAEFIFRRDENLDKLIEAFWKNEMRVSPQAYFSQLRLIKSRLYESR